MAKMDFTSFLNKFYKIIVTFVLIFLFFFIYNMFLIDKTLEGMRFSLEQANNAYSIEDLDGLDILLAGAVAEEVEPENIDSVRMGNLEFAKAIMVREEGYKQLKNVKLALSVAIDGMEKEGLMKFSIVMP